ncbi:DegT/DnrJ/EryC1/StrS aminotransferase family protein [Ornithobacterium rhinotracheale]|uniref:Putative PLP-dependent enzyme possibly involved in cell wall biogenesis n=3 Tax=Ornithobacterium rhinotracheale TaxID=28251 RepID=I3ZZD1_ORNRL|nr:aminotransferase class I/II-fold pyridoxal phosphate-dependent enzyme [Ornithobacterium rhinotracheale]AFL97065.1 putative PLP-dependent enzyme possibly involved in cell wall biogenesis [Ornithobacterium rhinotracheale DSM 15997]AIP99186.1 pyridoxal phosphate-dependent aminotransferase [Ornithobacterium rhinotracheale ORT-UMN 88]KGB67055.1 pyridoxal phosphate-dependent aminotransferase [Ornithobacterium rhinotracheale H06-030791]MBN3662272.1 aminotransferase class I/II-fold pyridoxal phospha
MKSKIWLSSPHMGGNEQKYINEAFEQNWVAPLGPNVNGFEEDLRNFLGGKVHVAGLSAGTAALHLGLILLGVKAGDEVICQSMTFAASANPIKYLGAKPVFVDSEAETLNICPKALEEAIQNRIENGSKPKAIVAVHLYGMPYKHREIRSIADKYEIPILEDAAEALGSTYYGENCGTLGDISILSFNGNKIITTSGGGALVCKDEAIKQKAVFLATQARDDAPHYQHSQIGYNYRLSNICAGIGRGQMEVLAERVNQRRAMHAFYQELFKDFKDIQLLTEENEDLFSNHWLSVILLKDYEQREKLRLALAEENIESRPLWKPMHMQPVFSDAMYFGEKVSEDAFNRGLCLPSGSNLTNEDRDRIKSCILHALTQ